MRVGGSPRWWKRSAPATAAMTAKATIGRARNRRGGLTRRWYATCHDSPVSSTRDGTLFLVGTPIGNLADMTDRARETLEAVDIVAAEDTRRTGTLLKRFGIRARMVS